MMNQFLGPKNDVPPCIFSVPNLNPVVEVVCSICDMFIITYAPHDQSEGLPNTDLGETFRPVLTHGEIHSLLFEFYNWDGPH